MAVKVVACTLAGWCPLFGGQGWSAVFTAYVAWKLASGSWGGAWLQVSRLKI